MGAGQYHAAEPPDGFSKQVLNARMVAQLTRLFKRESEPECPEIRMMASDYIDGDLDDKQIAQIRTHLNGCEACLAFFNTLVDTINLLGSTKHDEPAPAELKEAIRERIRELGHQHPN
jgi:anti-sigma factor (TIGR02949 family)